MKRWIAFFLFVTMALYGCSRTYSMHDGMYVQKQIEAGQISVPYILIDEGRFTVVHDIAVSYQPSGDVSQNGSRISLNSVYREENCQWVFELTADDTLKFLAEESNLPESETIIEDGTVFVLSKE